MLARLITLKRYVVDDTVALCTASSHALARQGLVFLPNSCTAAGAHCRIHIAFHGCGQSRATVGEAFTHGSELADWAVTNRLIVLFPQATTGPSNPQGCWDWWGYTGPDFLTRDAPQIKAVMRMVQRLAAAPGQS